MISREKFKIWGNVFDNFTERNIFKLSSQGHFKELKSPIQVGKEANVFSATTKEGLVAIKIYRLQSCNFNKMYYYIAPDPRYANIKKQRRKVIFSWVQREFRNLFIAREAGIRVPTPHTFIDNIIVMEFIGDKEAAPQLKDAIPENKKKFFEKVVEYMKKLHKAGLVHGDLSQFNILNHKEQPVFIDFSQATLTSNSLADEYLKRDIKNVCTFFRKIKFECDEEEVEERIKS